MQKTETLEDLELLRQFDTCTLSNAIEVLNIRLRNEGFVAGTATCRFPNLPPVLGYAVTGKVRASKTPVTGRCYGEHIQWWRYVAGTPSPRIIVIQDADQPPGFGALFGEVHARISRALGCVAYVTNGAVRDVTAIETMGFQLFSGSLAISHAYAHVVEFGEPVEIGGLRISAGDLLHGDLHGIQSIPAGYAKRLIRIARALIDKEQELFRLCESDGFNVEKLCAALEDNAGVTSSR